MSNVIVDVESIVNNIGKNIDFMQPVYESIVNSLEAKAHNIEIEFFPSEQVGFEKENQKIDSFIITDDGEGFILDNRNSFKKLWSTHKITMGCKGSGRFTWLNVYKNIQIQSFIKETNEIVEIPFSLNFGLDDIKVYDSNEKISKTKTIIKFYNLTKKFITMYLIKG